MLMVLSKATTPEKANPVSARLIGSPHWLVLQQRAPRVASALEGFTPLPEEELRKGWARFDTSFGMAAQDRKELVEAQRLAAQNAALDLLAAAGIDPRSCRSVFRPEPDGERIAAVLPVYERTRSSLQVTQRTLPRRFFPDDDKVVIYPPGALLRGNRPGGSP